MKAKVVTACVICIAGSVVLGYKTNTEYMSYLKLNPNDSIYYKVMNYVGFGLEIALEGFALGAITSHVLKL